MKMIVATQKMKFVIFHEKLDELQITQKKLWRFIEFEENETTETDEVSESSACTEKDKNNEVAIDSLLCLSEVQKSLSIIQRHFSYS